MDGDNANNSDDSGHWQYKPNDSASDATPGQTDTDNQAKGDSAAVSGNQMLHPDDYLPHTGGTVTDSGPSESISWTASEFIAHQKSFGWYAILALVTAIVSAVVYFITHDKISTGVIIFAAIIFGIYAARKPRTLNFTVDSSGLTIGNRFYDYGQFRSFALVQEDAFASIVFMPDRRFMPLITVYYDPKDERKITEILSNKIPLDTHELDFMEQFMRRIRF